MVNLIELKKDLTRDEAKRKKPYLCSAGKVTIGIGRNLDDRGLSEDEIDLLYQNDVDIVVKELDAHHPWWRDLPEPAGRALVNMAFNLGLPRLNKFRKMLIALQEHRFNDAATEALDSRWADQVGDRAQRIAELYRGCE